jgi:hypothetical protein
MAFPATAFKRLSAALLVAGMVVTRVCGQAADSPIKFLGPDAITTTMVDTPIVTGGGGSSGGTSPQWLKIEFHYSVDPKGPVPFVDAIQFNITMEARDLYAKNAPGEDGVAVGLTGTATYVNIAPTRDGYGVFYICPSALARYGSKRGTDDFTNKFNIHLEAMVGGKLADYFDKRPDPMGPDWYKALTPIAGQVYRQDQCIFMMIDPGRYPQLKPPTQ